MKTRIKQEKVFCNEKNWRTVLFFCFLTRRNSRWQVEHFFHSTTGKVDVTGVTDFCSKLYFVNYLAGISLYIWATEPAPKMSIFYYWTHIWCLQCNTILSLQPDSYGNAVSNRISCCSYKCLFCWSSWNGILRWSWEALVTTDFISVV